ncbi:porin [Vibrio sp. SCSIO 43135]|uniref:porin n=1 Tax=Vibrio sp. SCSIO 43135 TaxID=2819096 RepID=UPI002076011E|nr:porin [Vibrio sp. SCSIO 43135]USD43238.1 porin [Vibrio sp. SCSIO 43135]
MKKITMGLCALISTCSGFATAAPIYITDDNKLNMNGDIYSGYLRTSEYKKDNDVSQNQLDSYFRLGFQGASYVTESVIAIGEAELEVDIADTASEDGADTRLGYVGLMSQDYGTLTFGKQYTSSRLLTSWTDTGVSRMSDNDAVMAPSRVSNVLKFELSLLGDRLTLGGDKIFEYSSEEYNKRKGSNAAATYHITDNISVGAGYLAQRVNFTAGEAWDSQSYLTAARYNNGGFSAALVLDKTTDKAQLGDHKALEASVMYDVERYRFVTRFMKRNADIDERDVETITFGLQYRVNKHLDLLSEFNSSIQNHDYNQFTVAAQYQF